MYTCNAFTPQIKGNHRAIYLIFPSPPGQYHDIAWELLFDVKAIKNFYIMGFNYHNN